MTVDTETRIPVDIALVHDPAVSEQLDALISHLAINNAMLHDLVTMLAPLAELASSPKIRRFL